MHKREALTAKRRGAVDQREGEIVQPSTEAGDRFLQWLERDGKACSILNETEEICGQRIVTQFPEHPNSLGETPSLFNCRPTALHLNAGRLHGGRLRLAKLIQQT